MGKMQITILVEDYAGYDSAFYGEHGFSALIQRFDDNGKQYNVLFDCGTSGEVLLHNMNALGIHPEQIDILAFSHCHYDHTGGLIPFLEKRKGKPLPIIAHPLINRKSWTLEPDWRMIGMPEGAYEASSEQHQVPWILSRTPVPLGDKITWLGEIPRVHDISLAKDLLTSFEDGPVVDAMPDDTGILLELGDKAVIVAGCSHAGALNIAELGQSMAANKKIAAYIGGLHLISSPTGTGTKLGESLKAFGIKDIYTGHCTGFQAEKELSQVDGIRFRKLHCGMVIKYELNA